ncbi:photosynthetic reaction center subunit H [Afifella sp. IM 167]|uniref:photosynthetic reaction center subunit H n=1 Tax=Afifella sp. IM 167 TaxID=2033586 RepID=UPI001CCF55C7|nr:photosynthetic reaction center subunit H [Afifella sp. IM 167]MBZ8132217.1 photosynthetic reaction center subunit H [Afifella sp. IM 167]
MPAGALTSHMDVAQMVLYAFWIFFAGLIIYLRREDKREGYPLVAERAGGEAVIGFPDVPEPKLFRLHDGSIAKSGRVDAADPRVTPAGVALGSPFMPVGNPLVDGIGPAAYSERSNEPELTLEGEAKIVPLASVDDHFLDPRDPDPRGMLVEAADRVIVGTVDDVWVDRSDPMIRYLQVDLNEGGTALVPSNLATISGALRRVKVNALVAKQFADVPATASATQITMREEDRIMGYFGGGLLYATPDRQEPLL